jgi:hypothetical protein
MEYVWGGLSHGCQRGIHRGDLEFVGHFLGPFPIEVGNADDFDKGEAAQGPGVVGADIPGPHQSYPDFVWFQHVNNGPSAMP